MVTFVQRFGSSLNLNIHLHVITPDGVFVRDGRGVRFVPVTPDRAMVERVVGRARKSMLRRLGHKGYLSGRESNETEEPDGLLAQPPKPNCDHAQSDDPRNSPQSPSPPQYQDDTDPPAQPSELRHVGPGEPGPPGVQARSRSHCGAVHPHRCAPTPIVGWCTRHDPIAGHMDDASAAQPRHPWRAEGAVEPRRDLKTSDPAVMRLMQERGGAPADPNHLVITPVRIMQSQRLVESGRDP